MTLWSHDLKIIENVFIEKVVVGVKLYNYIWEVLKLNAYTACPFCVCVQRIWKSAESFHICISLLFRTKHLSCFMPLSP